MTPAFTLFVVLPCLLLARSARADDALYRCEAADGGVSVQSTPCPKGVAQRRIPFERPAEPVAPPPTAPAPPPAPLVSGHPVTPASAMLGPNDPYPLWECMRADGSTFESRTGVPGRQWVATAASEAAAADVQAADENAKLVERMKKGGPILRSYSVTTTASEPTSTTPDANAAPAGAVPGKWVADQCQQLEPAQACARFAVRRDALRKQIYAAKPSERSLYAPEEQDLTIMLYTACGR